MYIVIEGQDGTGKTTQANLLAQYYKQQGKKVIILNEPDGDIPQAHDLHELILSRGYNLEPLSNVLLFTAARVELWQKLAVPILKDGGVVVSARNWWSTLAYQSHGEGIAQEIIINITKQFLPKEYLAPNKSVILTTSSQVRSKRQDSRGKTIETFEKKDNDFQTRVNKAYLKIAKTYHIPIIDASGSIEQVFDQIKTKLGV